MARKDTRDTHQKLIDAADAALVLAEQSAWDKLAVHDIADKAGLVIGDIYDLGGKPALLAEIDRMFDRAMGVGLTPMDPDAEGPERRERLVDVMMQRFDAMEKHRTAVANINSYLMNTPSEAAKATVRRLKTASWALTAAGLDGDGVNARAVGIAATFLSAKAVWLDDEAPNDMTMAHIDRDLRKYSDWMRDIEKATGWATDAVKDFMAQFSGRKSRRDTNDEDVYDARPASARTSDIADDDDLAKPPPPL